MLQGGISSREFIDDANILLRQFVTIDGIPDGGLQVSGRDGFDNISIDLPIIDATDDVIDVPVGGQYDSYGLRDDGDSCRQEINPFYSINIQASVFACMVGGFCLTCQEVEGGGS